MKRRLLISLVSVAAFLLFAIPALADSASLNITIPNSQLAAQYPNGTVFGTINLNLNGSGGIDVSIAMAPGFGIFGQGGAFGFNVVGSTAGLTITGLSSGFSQGAAGQMDGFGNFQFVINGPPPAGNPPTALSFTVSRTGGFSSVFDIVTGSACANADQCDFAAHVYAFGSGLTGFAGNGVTPEPATLVLLGSGLLGLGGYVRRRTKN